MNNDKIKDQVEKAKGKAKEGTGKAVGNKELEQKEKIRPLPVSVRDEGILI